MIDRPIDIGRCYGMEMNVEKTKVKRILNQPFPVYLMKLENVADFSHLVSLITKDAKFFS